MDSETTFDDLTAAPARRSRRPSLGQIVIRIARLALIAAALLIVSQDIQIFPGALTALVGDSSLQWPLPQGVESRFVTTADGVQIELWRLPAAEATGRVALIFHGNGGNVRHFFAVQRWFRSIGVTSYAFDYRGFGKSAGWPSEEGIHRDAQAAWNYLRERESVTPENLIVFGLSIGTGPASRLARELPAGTLMLVSPYESLPRLVKDRPLLGILTPFLWYEFPTARHIEALQKTCLIVAHGERDQIIAPYHAFTIAKSYRGSGKVIEISDPVAGHNDLFSRIKGELGDALDRCDSHEQAMHDLPQPLRRN